MTDVTILYQGGSGGFALYYYLLLSGQYQYSIETVHGMIMQQFPLELTNNPGKWKNKEFWPDNIKLKTQSGPKVFLICNPLFNTDMHEQNTLVSNGTYKILLYTDIHLQLRLAYKKKAYWFTQTSRQFFNAPPNNQQYFRYILNSSKQYNGSQVDPALLDVIKKFAPDQIVRLEDFINLKILNGFSEPNHAQLNFLEYWLSLQPKKFIKYLHR